MLGYVPYDITSTSAYTTYLQDNYSNYAQMGYYKRLTNYDTVSDESKFMRDHIDANDFQVGSTAVTCNLYPYINSSTKV